MSQRLDFKDYTVVLFCPLVIEQQAASLMLDEIHDEILERTAGQTVLYTFGKIASHNVAIAGYPVGEVGIGVSGSMVAETLRDFPNLEAGILVGIAAGIPSATHDIRLGDVAVAVPNGDCPGIIGYDLVKIEEEEVRLKQWQNSTHPLLRSSITIIQVRENRPGSGFIRHLSVLEGVPDFKKPGPVLPSTEFPNPVLRDHPVAHYGTILSGNGVIKSKIRRDDLRDRYNGIAIEMEAAGMTTRLPVAVVRGISDFADSNKNDEWHKYAAVTAAAYAKEMLVRLGPRKRPEPELQSVISPSIDAGLRFSLPESCSFFGREAELAKLEDKVAFGAKLVPQRSIVTVWGMAGVGKSQLVAEFVKRQRLKYPDTDMFWVSGVTKEAFEQSILSILKVSCGPEIVKLGGTVDSDEQRTKLIDSFFLELRNGMRTRWILVIDGISGDKPTQQHIKAHLDVLPWGSVILTTGSSHVASWYHGSMKIKGLSEKDAVKLLVSEIDETLGSDDEGMLELAKALRCHPLSLRLAVSIICHHHVTPRQYLHKWKKRLLYYEYTAHLALSRSFEISFEELEATDPLAAKLLKLFGYLDHRDLWLDLCANAPIHSPKWVLDVKSAKSFNRHRISMHNLSFIEAKSHDEGQGQEIYEIHPAIHEFARQKTKEDQKEYLKTAVSLIAAKIPRSVHRDFVKIVKRLESHADQCMLYLEQGRGGVGLDLAELERFGDLYRYLGRYKQARGLYLGILNILYTETVPDAFTLDMMAGIENNLGLVYHAQREYTTALRLYDRSLSRRRKASVQDADASMITRYNKGRAFLLLGRMKEAMEALLEAAAHFRSSCLDPIAPDEVARKMYFQILNDIGEICLRENNLKQAEDNFKQAFDGFQEHLHHLHPSAFAVRVNIGRLCVEQSRFGTANKIFEFTAAIYMEWWGRNHSETMRVIAELAESHMRHAKMKIRMGDDAERELSKSAELWTEVLTFYEEAFGHKSDLAVNARSKIQQLRLLGTEVPQDPYILITGASRGLGLTLAISFAKAGASQIAIGVCIGLSSSSALVIDATSKAGRKRLTVLELNMDVSDPVSVDGAAAKIRSEFGCLDIVVNSAGILTGDGNIVDSDPEGWSRNFDINTKGLYLVLRAFIPLLLSCEGKKTVVYVSSIGAHCVSPTLSEYQISKLATLRLAEFATAEYGDKGLLVSSIHPSSVATEMVLQQWPQSPELSKAFADKPELAGDSIVHLTSEKID